MAKIKLLSYTTAPDDYNCNDGELSLSLCAINERGALRPLPAPVTLMRIGKGQTAFLHNAPDGQQHFIAYTPGSPAPTTLTFLNETGDPTDPGVFELPDTVVSVAAIGNTLIISGEQSLYYFLLADHRYKYLGTGVPTVDIDFALKSKIVVRDYQAKLEFLDPDDDEKQTSYFQEFFTAKFSDVTCDPYKYRQLKAEGYVADWPMHPASGGTITDPCTSTPMALNHEFPKGSYALDMSDEYFNNIPQESYIHIIDRQTKQQVARLDRNRKHDIVWTFTLGETYSSGQLLIILSYPGASTPESKRFNFTLPFSTNLLQSTGKVSKYLANTPDTFNSVFGAINSFVNDEAIAKNRFIHPFFVRYALRLYDGTLTSLSSPQLMTPNNSYAPIISYQDIKHTKPLSATAFISSLQYRILSNISDDWKDLVSAVEIYISAPVYPYDQSAEAEEGKLKFKYSQFQNVFDSTFAILDLPECESYSSYQLRPNLPKFGFIDYDKRRDCIQIAPRSQEQLRDQLLFASSQMFKVCSIDVDKIKPMDTFADIDIDDNQATEDTTADIADESLKAIYNREPLELTTLPYNGFAGASMLTYNSRLNLYGASYRLPAIHFGFRMEGHVDAHPLYRAMAVVSLHTDQGDKTVVSDIEPIHKDFGWIFYPDNRAYQIAIYGLLPDGEEGYFHCQFELKEHPYLNGAYWLAPESGRKTIGYTTGTPPEIPATDDRMPAPTTVYLSEPANPFAFSMNHVCSIPGRKILGIVTSALPISQGQFGQYPLYAFTDQGIWALSITAIGTYAAVQPVTYDVCNNRDSITTLERRILFTTAHGLMRIAGGDTQSLSQNIDSQFPFLPSSLPHLRDILQKLDTHSSLIDAIDPDDFLQFTQNARLLFDYRHQHIYLYSPRHKYAYVQSLVTGAWATVPSQYAYTIQAYPECLAVTHDGRIVTLSQSDNKYRRIVIMTRPIKFGEPDMLKTVQNSVVRGLARPDRIRTLLYGTRDLQHWHPVASSTTSFLRGRSGTPYKYFRYVIIADVDPDETIDSIEIKASPRHTNQLR